MFTFSLTAEPSNAAVALEALEHIKAAIAAIAKAARGPVAQGVATIAPKQVVGPEAAPEKADAKPAERAVAPEVEAEPEAAPKRRGRPKGSTKKAEPEKADVDELSGDDLLAAVREAGIILGKKFGPMEVVKLLETYGAKKYPDLTDDNARDFIRQCEEMAA